MNASADARIFEFGGLRLDVAQRRLFGTDGAPIELSSRAFDLLLHMVERPGSLLDKSELMQAVWPKTVVEEGNLSQSIFVLRRALGEQAGESRFIKTVTGRGYQFVAPVRIADPTPDHPIAATATSAPVEAVTRPARTRLLALLGIGVAGALLAVHFLWPRADALDASARASPPAIEASTIAVLPFADLSASKEMGYFTDGMADELMNSLAKVHGVHVIGRRSAFAPNVRGTDAKTLGERLRVENILEGSVRREGDRIRISAQLTRARDGYNLWSESYDRKLDDVLDVQATIAGKVVAALAPVIRQEDTALSGKLQAQQTKSSDAYTAYLHGVYHYRRRDFWVARDALEKAVKLDATYVAAHAYLARTYMRLSEWSPGRSTEFRDLASAEVDKALQLDPHIADVWWIASSFADRESTPTAYRAEMLERALESNPDDCILMNELAYTYVVLGRRDKAHTLFERAYRTDPLWRANIGSLANSTLIYAGDRKRYLELADEVEQLDPHDVTGGLLEMRLAFIEGRAADWDRLAAQGLAVSALQPSAHVYFAWDYANAGLFNAALHHARVCRGIAPEEPGSCGLAHVWLMAGNLEAARAVVMKDSREAPNDLRATLARGEYEYFAGDCESARKSIVTGLPQLGRPAASLDLGAGASDIPLFAATLAWCLRKTGNDNRAAELAHQLKLQFPSPYPGMWNAIHARMAAATGDEAELKRQLGVMASSPSMGYAFSRHEPLFAPWLRDPQIDKLFQRVEAHYAAWRKASPTSTVQVPIPGITTDEPGS